MKTGVNLAKIVSTSIALIVCSAVLAFALTALCWGAALPAYAKPAACTGGSQSFTINPTSGAVGQSVTVSGNNVIDGAGNCVSSSSVNIGYGISGDCSSTQLINSATTDASGSFSDPFQWPTSAATLNTAYPVCVTVSGSSGAVYQAGTFTVTSGTSTSTLLSTPTSGGPGTTITVSGSSTATTVSAVFGYSTDITDNTCNPFTAETSATTETVTNSIFSGTFSWPSGLTVGTTYMVCAQINGGSAQAASEFQDTSSSSSTASVDVDNSSYTVGDSMTVTLSGFPASTTVSLTVQTSGGSNAHDLNLVTTDSTGASTTVHTAPSSPTGTVEIVADAGSVTATSSTFTIKKKAAAPAPAPAAAPPAPAPVYYPPAAPIATPTPIPVPTDTPTPVPTDTPTPVPTPTVAPVPTAVPVAANTNTGFLGGKVPLALAIGLGALIGLGLLFVIGRLLLGKFLSPSPAPNMSPGAAIPWLGSQGDSLQQNTMMNGVPLGQTMPFDSSFPPGNGGFAPGYGPPQQVPFNGPFGSGTGAFPPVPADGGFAPDPANSPQPVPIGGPYQPGTSGFAPVNANQQEPFPPDNWFGSPN